MGQPTKFTYDVRRVTAETGTNVPLYELYGPGLTPSVMLDIRFNRSMAELISSLMDVAYTAGVKYAADLAVEKAKADGRDQDRTDPKP